MDSSIPVFNDNELPSCTEVEPADEAMRIPPEMALMFKELQQGLIRMVTVLNMVQRKGKGNVTVLNMPGDVLRLASQSTSCPPELLCAASASPKLLRTASGPLEHCHEISGPAELACGLSCCISIAAPHNPTSPELLRTAFTFLELLCTASASPELLRTASASPELLRTASGPPEHCHGISGPAELASGVPRLPGCQVPSHRSPPSLELVALSNRGASASAALSRLCPHLHLAMVLMDQTFLQRARHSLFYPDIACGHTGHLPRLLALPPPNCQPDPRTLGSAPKSFQLDSPSAQPPCVTHPEVALTISAALCAVPASTSPAHLRTDAPAQAGDARSGGGDHRAAWCVGGTTSGATHMKALFADNASVLALLAPQNPAVRDCAYPISTGRARVPPEDEDLLDAL
ncbi:hypothetical protein GGX14DRAFT_579293 [Mycena pura]|uniref:Uncharacterized protein n=1 Tax=Mycena pura TaxID=153505 RepID=A0AAD6US14_9AGAR|nr:hypothetical protein GGX14DRAFT_579293 [Mycena pura]